MVFSDKYTWGAKLGAGAFGEVRRARCRATGEELAVKTLRAGQPRRRPWPLSLLDRPRTPLSCIQREAETWRRVGQHANVVRFVDVCLSSSGFHFVMERCGSSLQEAMTEFRGCGLAEVWRIARRIARELLLALAHVHARSVLHRDVKPANVLFGTDPCRTLKLCDFGAAVVVGASGEHRGVGGTLNYLSPECLRTQVFSAKSDVWAAGVTLYKVLHGSHPYACPESQETIADNVATGRVQPKYSPTREACRGALRGAALQSAELLAALLRRDAQLRADAVAALGLEFPAVEEATAPPPEEEEEEEELAEESQATACSNAASATAQRPRGFRCCFCSEAANAVPEAAICHAAKGALLFSKRDEDAVTEAPPSAFFANEGSVICR